MGHPASARKWSGSAPHAGGGPPLRTLEVGGGLSLGLAASLDQPSSLLLLSLGGLLPFVAFSLSIAAHRARQWLVRPMHPPGASGPIAWPTPHLLGSRRLASPRSRGPGPARACR